MGVDCISSRIVCISHLQITIKKIMVQGLTSVPLAAWFFKLQQRPLILLVPVYIVLILIGWSNYFPWQSPASWFGLIVMSFLCKSGSGSKSTATFYLYAAAFFITLTLILPVKTLLYFSLVLGVLLFIETSFVKCGYLPLLTMIIISPIFNYVTTVFTFPIRLELSSIAAQILGFMNPAISNSGNIIHFNGADFSVDAECMGLSMISIGLLTGVLLLNHYQRRIHLTICFLISLLFLMFIILLVVLCNLFRIVFLVQFHVFPETFMHELAGLICFIIYVLLPATLLMQFLIKRKAGQIVPEQAHKIHTDIKYIILKNLLVVFGLITIIVYVKMKETTHVILPANTSIVSHYKTERLSSDITKLENEYSIVYIKPVKGF